MRSTIFLVLLLIASTSQAQTYSLKRPVPDTTITAGQFLTYYRIELACVPTKAHLVSRIDKIIKEKKKPLPKTIGDLFLPGEVKDLQDHFKSELAGRREQAYLCNQWATVQIPWDPNSEKPRLVHPWTLPKKRNTKGPNSYSPGPSPGETGKPIKEQKE